MARIGAGIDKVDADEGEVGGHCHKTIVIIYHKASVRIESFSYNIRRDSFNLVKYFAYV